MGTTEGCLCKHTWVSWGCRMGYACCPSLPALPTRDRRNNCRKILLHHQAMELAISHHVEVDRSWYWKGEGLESTTLLGRQKEYHAHHHSRVSKHVCNLQHLQVRKVNHPQRARTRQ